LNNFAETVQTFTHYNHIETSSVYDMFTNQSFRLTATFEADRSLSSTKVHTSDSLMLSSFKWLFENELSISKTFS